MGSGVLLEPFPHSELAPGNFERLMGADVWESSVLLARKGSEVVTTRLYPVANLAGLES